MKHGNKAAPIEGALIGTNGYDRFVLAEGDGAKIVQGFDTSKDDVMFVYHSYSDVLGFGQLYDGQTIIDFTGQTTIHVAATDINADGVTDTTFTVGSDSITLLGVAPTDLYSGSIMGG